MTAEPVLLPQTPADPPRPSLPFIAAIVPVAAGVVMWLVTGSALALCFAFLGPLMIVGSFLDGIRRRRRERRRATSESDAAWRRAAEEVDRRREAERAGLWTRHPDVLHCLAEPPLREDRPLDGSTPLVLGRGDRAGTLRLSGGDGEHARTLRDRAAVLDDAPVDVALGRGVCIRAEPVLGEPIARALIAQLCLRFAPSRLALVDVEEGPVRGFAHAGSPRRDAFRLSTGGTVVQASEADAMIRVIGAEEAVPDGVTTVLEGRHPDDMTLRTPDGTRPIRVECLSAAQTEALALQSADGEPEQARLPDRLLRTELIGSEESARGLAAAIGRGIAGELAVDLVADGPHAIVTGMTGAGKSELLVTWITALAERRGPEEVVFVLADFKGGTAFEPLRALPQVSAVLTDLDASGADRGVRSLTAELRRRERVLARAGARDIAEVDMPRLVIVIDEFAALLQEHPDLAAVFTDVAARGRALGMHLILGTQRASGVIRDALAANCPLRISLRVADRADSRMMIGGDDAAELEGGPASRGLACVRRPQDAQAQTVRIAMTDAADLRSVAMRWAGAARPTSPWLPALPERLPLAQLPASGDGGATIGLADDPDHQAQPAISLLPGRDRGIGIVGGPGSGKSSAVRLLRERFPDAVVVPSDAEQGWDAVAALSRGVTPRTVVLGDDVDRLLAALPGEHAQACADLLEAAVRGTADSLIVLTAGRLSGPVARVLEALPQRMLLGTSSRAEHFAAGGETATFRPRPPGRGSLAGREVQLGWVDESDAVPAETAGTRPWTPEAGITGIVGAGGAGLAATVAARFPDVEVQMIADAPRSAAAMRPGGPPEPRAAERRLVLIGDPDDWQRDWAQTQRVRTEGEMLVTAEQPAALRTLLGIRDLPPYARPHAGRAWSVRDGGRPVRVLLPK